MSMDDRVPPTPRVFRLDSPPSPDAVRMETEDVLVWDERYAWCKISEWPTRSWCTFFFVPPFSAKAEHNPNRALCRLLDDGWKVRSCTLVWYGFLWLKKSRYWTMTRRVEWLRDGTETSFVGHRVTPGVFKDEDEGKTWVTGA